MKKKNLQSLIKKLEVICYFNDWNLSYDEYEELFDEIIDNLRKVNIQNKKNETIVKFCFTSRKN